MPNSENKKIRIDKGLFADDTNLVGRKKEMAEGLKAVKEVMDKFEERNNEDKEEEIIFGTEESNKIRILGSYLGPGEDVKQRLKRAGATWVKVERFQIIQENTGKSSAPHALQEKLLK